MDGETMKYHVSVEVRSPSGRAVWKREEGVYDTEEDAVDASNEVRLGPEEWVMIEQMSGDGDVIRRREAPRHTSLKELGV